MITPEDILEVMGRRVSGVCPNVFPQDRPNATDAALKEFVVVSLPYSESNRMLGEDDDWWLDMTVVYEIYVADKKSAGNPKQLDLQEMKRLREDVRGIFPVVDDKKRFIITRPRTVINATSDGNGYHFSRIQAKLTTMV